MASGILKPCQIARLYSGNWPPRLALAAEASNGATVQAGSMPTTRHRSTRISTGIFM
ncbi:hypothetical protein D3C77_804230 [compost metagenome]